MRILRDAQIVFALLFASGVVGRAPPPGCAVRNRISNRLLNSPLRAMRFGVACPCLLKSPGGQIHAMKITSIGRRDCAKRGSQTMRNLTKRRCQNIVLTVFLANLRKLKRAAHLASRYLTPNCVDAMFVRATVL